MPTPNKDVLNVIFFIIFCAFFDSVSGFLCYNGTFSTITFGEDPITHNNIFATDHRFIARLRCSTTILCPEGAVCFVRSWKARAKHAWIVQRGCYEKDKEDALSLSLSVPIGSMSCKRQRLADAEYKVCLCQGDKCNGGYFHFKSSNLLPLVLLNLLLYFYAQL